MGDISGIRVSAAIDNKEYIIETGKLANQAHGSVWVQSGDTVVLVTAVTQPLDREIDFMPLTVEYQEMSYASGRIPGSYFKREIGRPSEREILVSRLIDRPLRPLFPDGFRQEVQIIATVLSADPNCDPDVLAVNGASCALHLSQIPFLGPIGCVRVAYVDGNFVINPSSVELEYSKMDLVVAGTKDAVVMVEGSCNFVSEELVVEGIEFAHKHIHAFVELQEDLRNKAGKPKIEVEEKREDIELLDAIEEVGYKILSDALRIPTKVERKMALKQAQEEIIGKIEQRYASNEELFKEKLKHLPGYIKKVESKIVREWIKNGHPRIDGRKLTDIRNIDIEIGILPRAHGSALFARGETKALGVVTLGSSHDEQHIETLTGDFSKRFMVHYNFPPYCVGEAKKLRGPSRREIGHGALAEKSLTPILPSPEEFPFTIRLVSEIMESNGSSSMATVCAGSLALMDAGIPVKSHVAGVAMGLIKEDDEFFILTDILGDEDHLGDMDFKVAGNREGITGIQLDIKITGISKDILIRALKQAREARFFILDKMESVISKPREQLSEYAPKIEVIEVTPDRIKDIIGPSGKNIKAIVKETGATVDIEDNGKITIFAPDKESLDKTIEKIMFYDQKPELGKTYNGKIKLLKDFGAIVEILPGVNGLVHISQLDIGRINNIYKSFSPGQKIKVKVIEIEEGTGKIKLSRKAVLLDEQKRGGHIDQRSSKRPVNREKGLKTNLGYSKKR
ncbi:polyribonucleotide nucleotidyltransferase [Desulfothermus naphthae]